MGVFTFRLEKPYVKSSELSIRKLGNEASVLRTSLRRSRNSNSANSDGLSATDTASTITNTQTTGSLTPSPTLNSLNNFANNNNNYNNNRNQLNRTPEIQVDDFSDQIDYSDIPERAVEATPTPEEGSDQLKLLWKLSRVARRWYYQLKDDFSEIQAFDIDNNKPLIAADEVFSIKYTTDTLNRFDDLFAALVDGSLRDAYNEFLKLSQWTYPIQTLLTIIVLLHSLWKEYLVTMLLVALCVSLVRNYMIEKGWLLDKNQLDAETRKRPPAVRVSNLFSLNMRVAKTFHMISDLIDKGLSLWTWKRPDVTAYFLGALVGAAVLSLVVPAMLMGKLVGTVLLFKLFVLDYIFLRFPRVRAKYDFLYIWYNDLPTGPQLERQRKFQMSLKPSKSTSDLTSLRSNFDPSVLRKLEEKLSGLFELPSVESIVAGWELGKRCTYINKDRSLTSAFKSGRLFLTEKYLLFMRYKTASPKNLSIPLEQVTRVEKAKHSGWLPGDAQTLQVYTIHNQVFTFGALSDRDEVHREILIHVAQNAYRKRR